MSLEEWQRRLRKQFASEQPFRVENIGEHPIFPVAMLLTRRGAKRVFLAGYEPPYSSISVEYGRAAKPSHGARVAGYRT